MSYVPLAAHIRRMLDERGSHAAPKSRFLDELEDYMTPDDGGRNAARRDRLGPVRRMFRL